MSGDIHCLRYHRSHPPAQDSRTGTDSLYMHGLRLPGQHGEAGSVISSLVRSIPRYCLLLAYCEAWATATGRRSLPTKNLAAHNHDFSYVVSSKSSTLCRSGHETVKRLGLD
jgi:hypothetical protein